MSMWDHVVNGVVVFSDDRPRSLQGGNIVDPLDETLNAHGWYERQMGYVPAGQYATGWTWIGIVDNRSLYTPALADIPEPPPEPDPIPERFANGIDTPLLVLDAPDGKGIGYVAADDGALVPVVYAHESPYDMVALQAKIAQARADHAATKAAHVAEAKATAEAAGKTNSVNALRAEVARLAAIVEALA